MQYFIGGVAVVFLLTYPIQRWQRKRMRRHPESIGIGTGGIGADPGDSNPQIAEAILRGGGTSGSGGRPTA